MNKNKGNGGQTNFMLNNLATVLEIELNIWTRLQNKA